MDEDGRYSAEEMFIISKRRGYISQEEAERMYPGSELSDIINDDRESDYNIREYNRDENRETDEDNGEDGE